MAAAFGRLSGSEESEKDAGRGAAARPESTSIVGRGTELVGDLVGSGQVRIEGRVDGTLRVDGQVQVAAGGEVDGEIQADRVVAAGTVSGSIRARDSVRLEEDCQVDADVFSPVLHLQEGGVINGRVDMSGRGQPGEHAPGGAEPEREADDASAAGTSRAPGPEAGDRREADAEDRVEGAEPEEEDRDGSG